MSGGRKSSPPQRNPRERQREDEGCGFGKADGIISARGTPNDKRPRYMSPANSGLPPGCLSGHPVPQSKIKFTIIAVLAVHALVLVGVLIQGCKQGPQAADSLPTGDVRPAPDKMARTGQNIRGTISKPPVRQTEVASAPTGALRSHSYGAAPERDAKREGMQALGEYTVTEGDWFFKIAKSRGISVKALEEANPGVDSTKLRIGQVLNLPVKKESVE